MDQSAKRWDGSLVGNGLKVGSSTGSALGNGNGSDADKGFKKLAGQRGRGSAGFDESKVMGLEFIMDVISWRDVKIELNVKILG